VFDSARILLKALDQRFEERLAHLEAVSSKTGTDTEVFEFRSAEETTHEQSSTSRQGDRRISIWVNLARMEMLSLFGKTKEMHAAMDQLSLLLEPKSDPL
jgi:hypothetical protein